MNNPLGVSPSKGNQGTTRGKEKISVLTSVGIEPMTSGLGNGRSNPEVVGSIPIPGGVLPYKRLLGMCRWMGSHFHDWTDYNGVAFLVQLLEWDRTFSGFVG